MTPVDLTKLDKYHDKWVAVSADQKEIKGVGNTPREAIDSAKRNGEEKPILTRTPKDYSTYIL